MPRDGETPGTQTSGPGEPARTTAGPAPALRREPPPEARPLTPAGGDDDQDLLVPQFGEDPGA